MAFGSFSDPTPSGGQNGRWGPSAVVVIQWSEAYSRGQSTLPPTSAILLCLQPVRSRESGVFVPTWRRSAFGCDGFSGW